MSDINIGTQRAAGLGGTTMGDHGSHHRVACLFETRAAAERAAEDLVAAGIGRHAIDIVDQAAESSHATAPAEGGGLWESIKRMFTGDDDVAGYYEGVNRGQTLLSVNTATADEAERAATVLERHDPIDLDAQEDAWRSAGWTGGARTDVTGAATGGAVAGAPRSASENATLGTPGAAGAAAANLKPAARTGATGESAMAGRATAAPGGLAGKDEVIPLVEENVAIGKRAVQGGRVRVRTHVVTSAVNEDVRLHDERVHLERRPVDRAADSAALAGDAFRERSIEMTESREEPVVSKSARVTEEVVLRQQGEDRVEQVNETVRHTEVDVDDQRAGRSADVRGTTGPAGSATERDAAGKPVNPAKPGGRV